MHDWLASARLWQAVGISAVTVVTLHLWRRLFPEDHHMQMGWMDWCGYYACVGALFLLVGSLAGWQNLTGAGLLLLLPLYPVAILGMLGKLDNTVTDIIRAVRRR